MAEVEVEDFSPDAVPESSPLIEYEMDGSQTLVFQDQCLPLPSTSVWTLTMNDGGEWFVTSPGRNAKSVKGLMKLKRVKEHPGRIQWGLDRNQRMNMLAYFWSGVFKKRHAKRFVSCSFFRDFDKGVKKPVFFHGFRQFELL